MSDIENVQVFGFCVADIMAQTYAAFPLATRLSAHRLDTVYGAQQAYTVARRLEPGDAEYEELFARGTDPDAGLLDVMGRGEEERYPPERGKPYNFWSLEQRNELRKGEDRLVAVKKVHQATVEFLVREGYLHRSELVLSGRTEQVYVLTSKGFAHLNKKFENKTIRDAFEFRTASKFFEATKGAGEVAAAGKGLVEVLSKFFM